MVPLRTRCGHVVHALRRSAPTRQNPLQTAPRRGAPLQSGSRGTRRRQLKVENVLEVQYWMIQVLIEMWLTSSGSICVVGYKGRIRIGRKIG